MSSSASMSMLLGSLSVLCCARRGERAAQALSGGHSSDVSEQACLSRERENGMPLVSFGPSGIGGEYQREIR
jgi:hypothetical protein